MWKMKKSGEHERENDLGYGYLKELEGNERTVLRSMLNKLGVRTGGRWNLFRIISIDMHECIVKSQVKSQW
jgi:hypothetical protein